MKVTRFGFSLFGINTYIVEDDKTEDCAVIDPGMIDAEEEEVLVGYIERRGLKVKHVINTHLHVDHAIGDKFVRDQYKVPVSGHKADEPLGKRMREQAAMFGMNEKVNNVSLTSCLNDGDVIKIGEGRLKVLHVPGHSPGSIALYDPEGGYVLSGDALFSGSVGRTDLPGGSMPQLISSITDKLLSLPDDTIVYPGHGPATTIGNEKKYNQFLRTTRE